MVEVLAVPSVRRVGGHWRRSREDNRETVSKLQKKVKMAAGDQMRIFSRCLRGRIPVQSLGHSEAIELCARICCQDPRSAVKIVLLVCGNVDACILETVNVM